MCTPGPGDEEKIPLRSCDSARMNVKSLPTAEESTRVGFSALLSALYLMENQTPLSVHQTIKDKFVCVRVCAHARVRACVRVLLGLCFPQCFMYSLRRC